MNISKPHVIKRHSRLFILIPSDETRFLSVNVFTMNNVNMQLCLNVDGSSSDKRITTLTQFKSLEGD